MLFRLHICGLTRWGFINYVQSPAYVYGMLLKELHLYPVSKDNEAGKVAEKDHWK